MLLHAAIFHTPAHYLDDTDITVYMAVAAVLPFTVNLFA